MMTGDRKETAEHVAQNIGLLRGGGASNAHLVITSSQLALMTDDQIKASVETIQIVLL
jgi:magnesium-transporting ATPase (P-type)